MTTDTLTATAVDAVANLAAQGAGPHHLEPGGYYAFQLGDRVHEVDLTGDRFADIPRRKTGLTTVRDVDSFAAYYAKHHDDASEVYADRDRLTITAVLDAHSADHPAWQEHRLTLALRHSKAWAAWAAFDGKLVEQEAFAEHLEDNRVDIAAPPAADMLEIAQSIQASTKAEFKSAKILASGARTLQYAEDVNARAGATGELTIPAGFVLRLPVFDGATFADEVTARFRYRISSGKLLLGYRLDRPADVVAAAFASVVQELGEACSATVLAGTPA